MNQTQNQHPGPYVYTAVVIILGAYFFWLCDRMAVFSIGGVVRLERLGVGLGLAVLGLVVASLIRSHARDPRRPSRPSDKRRGQPRRRGPIPPGHPPR